MVKELDLGVLSLPAPLQWHAVGTSPYACFLPKKTHRPVESRQLQGSEHDRRGVVATWRSRQRVG